MRFFLCLIPVFAPMAQSQVAPDARALLMRSGGAALTADTVRLEGTQSTNGNARPFSILRSTGGRMRMETRNGDATMLQISDGAQMWRYNSANNSYTQLPSPGGPVNDAFGRLKFSRDPAAIGAARVEREESLDFRGQPAPCYVVHAEYTSMPGIMAREIVRTVWIAKGSDLILRDIWEYKTSSSVRVTTDYTVIDWGMPLADDLFVFHPPEGSHAAPTATGDPNHAVPTRTVQPEYSAEARAAGLQGTVSLYVEVNSGGRPTTVHVMQGLGLGLDEEAVAAVERWEFQPKPAKDGIQDAFEVQVPFHLEPPAPWHVSSEVYWAVVPTGQRVRSHTKPVPKSYKAPDPAACRAEAAAVVELLIGKDGIPREVRATRGDGAVADAAVKAVAGWQFRPATLDGKTGESRGEVELACRPAGVAAKRDEPASPVYRVGGSVAPPVLLSKLEPEYTEEARKARLEGTSTLYVRISPSGQATEIHVMRRLGLGLDQKAMEAIKRWRFQPGMRNGTPVTVEATVEVNFRLL